MKIINIISILSYLIFYSCENEPKELLEKNSYYIPEICSDSVIVFGNNVISERTKNFFGISQVLNLQKNEIIQYESLIKNEILRFENIKDSILIRYLNNNNIQILKRQYLLYKRKDDQIILVVTFWNQNYNLLTKEIYLRDFKNSFSPIIHTLGDVGIIRMEIDVKNNKIVKSIRL
jgi:hypothetical protein